MGQVTTIQLVQKNLNNKKIVWKSITTMKENFCSYTWTWGTYGMQSVSRCNWLWCCDTDAAAEEEGDATVADAATVDVAVGVDVDLHCKFNLAHST